MNKQNNEINKKVNKVTSNHEGKQESISIKSEVNDTGAQNRTQSEDEKTTMAKHNRKSKQEVEKQHKAIKINAQKPNVKNSKQWKQ